MGFSPVEHFVPEAAVVSPNDMIAIGDAYDETNKRLYALTFMPGYQIGDEAMKQRARISTRKRHTGVFNVVFCDGHVEHMKPSKLSSWDDNALRRLNSDHEPHRDHLDENYPKVSD